MFDIKKRRLRYSDFPVIPFMEEKRDKTLWKSKSHNIDKQIFDFVSFVYFSYEAPVWALNYIHYIYTIFHTKHEGRINTMQYDFSNRIVFEYLTFSDIIPVVQTGKGFSALMSDFLNKKESHIFLFNTEATEFATAFIETKLKYINADKKIISWAKTRLSGNNFNSDVWPIISYLVKNGVHHSEIQELYDYVSSIYRPKRGHFFENEKLILPKDFFKRDINTVRQASNEWHIRQIKAKEGKFVEWNSTFENFVIEKVENIFEFEELTSSKALLEEGRRMCHCVGSYVSKCVKGDTKIVSLKKNYSSYLTLEIKGNSIIQAKLRRNATPDRGDINLINHFADKNDLKIAI